MPDLILASTSPYRRSLLERLCLSFQTMDPGPAEAEVDISGMGPADVAKARADAKGLAVQAQRTEALVLASDQVLELDGEILGKPQTIERHCAQLAALSGREHRLWTAVTLCTPAGLKRASVLARLQMRSLSVEEIERYVQLEPALDCAGGYKLEGLGIALFESIHSEDATSIIGLPLIATAQLLRAHGYQIP